MDRDGPSDSKGWQELAAEAATENDAAKLMALVEELCEAFDQSQEQLEPAIRPPTEDRV